MRPVTFVRPLSTTELRALNAGLHSPDAFTLRRCQILLASARGHSAAAIADFVGCTPPAVHHAGAHNQADCKVAGVSRSGS
jgi:hypothetical protein